MLVTDAGITIVLSEQQSENAPVSMLVTDDGITIVLSDRQS